MSPKLPEPIFRTKRYFAPTMNSLLDETLPDAIQIIDNNFLHNKCLVYQTIGLNIDFKSEDNCKHLFKIREFGLRLV